MKAAGILFVAPDHTALFIKRSMDSDHPGEWALPGGHTANGETPLETAKREAAEEIGDYPQGNLHAIAKTQLEGVDFSTFRQDVAKPFSPQLNSEHTAFKWAPVASPPEPLHPGVRIALEAKHALDMKLTLAFDRGTVRTIDQDGRLHVELTNISKANICPYYGSEIPNADALGLDAKTVYQLLRDPEELEKGAATFNNIPLLSTHIPVSADAPQKEMIVGSTGTDAVFQAPYLCNSLVVWDAVAIAGIESGEQKELSCGYRYRADMTPGTYKGIKYDGVMRDISGNHVALVEQGRAGGDVVVGDSMETSMSKQMFLSRKAAMAKGALAVFLKPKLAMDAKIDLTGLLIGVTSSNWLAKKSSIVAGLRSATAGKLAQDASIEDVVGLLDSLDGEKLGDLPDDNLSNDVNPDDNLEGELDASGTEVGAEDGPLDKVRAFLKGKISDEDLAELEAMMSEGASDDADGDMDEEALLKKLQELLEGLSGGSVPAQDAPPTTPGTPAPPATSTKPEDKKVNQPAMDKAIAIAIKTAETNTIKRMRDVAEAEKAVRPLIGELAIAQDSAEAVYRLALEANGVDVAGVSPSAFKAMVGMLSRPGSERANTSPHKIAQDSGNVVAFQTRYPGAAKVRQLG